MQEKIAEYTAGSPYSVADLEEELIFEAVRS